MAVENTTSTLSNEVAIWYDKVFLERARAMLVHQEGGQFRGLEGNQGKQTIFNRFRPLALATTPLTESNNPNNATLVSDQVTVTLQEYGQSARVSRLLSTTDIDDRDKEKIDVIGQNMGETLDALVRNALYNGATVINSVTTVFTPALVAQANAQLTVNKALAYAGTYPWIGKIQPETELDLIQSTTWINAATYSNVNALYEGEVGALYGVRFLKTNQGYQVAGSSPAVTYSNFIHGREAFGVYDNKLDPPKLYIVTGADSNNPTERYHVLSWAGQFAAAVLNATWVLNVETKATLDLG